MCLVHYPQGDGLKTITAPAKCKVINDSLPAPVMNEGCVGQTTNGSQPSPPVVAGYLHCRDGKKYTPTVDI